MSSRASVARPGNHFAKPTTVPMRKDIGIVLSLMALALCSCGPNDSEHPPTRQWSKATIAPAEFKFWQEDRYGVSLPASKEALKSLHKTIKKVQDDIEGFSFNTSVSQFMICVNELTSLNCHKRSVLEPLAVLIAPFAPHTAEELWHQLGNEGTVMDASFPKFEETYVTENTKKYPVAVNGKPRIEMEFPLDAAQDIVEKEVLADATIIKWLEGKEPKKIIYVKGKMINVVV